VTNDDTIAAKLDELIAATRAASVPFKGRWVSAATIGAMLECSPRKVLETYAPRPDFPKANREGGHPRWKASEVLEWYENLRDQSRAA
jgi:predicted DNA-binding transcriptional regulator AlpA